MKPMEKTFQNSSTEKKFSREWNTCRPNKVRGYYPVPKRCSITICGTKGQEDPHSAEKKHSQWRSRCCPDLMWFLFHFFLEEQERSHITLGLLSH